MDSQDYKARMAQEDALAATIKVGERCKLPTPNYTGLRTLYPVTKDGELVAFLGVKMGWGKGWRLWPVKVAIPGSKLDFGGFSPDTDRHASDSTSSKERAPSSLAMFMMISPKKYRTAAAIKGDVTTMAAVQVQNAKEYLASLQANRVRMRDEVAVLDKLDTSQLSMEDRATLAGLRDKLETAIASKDSLIERQKGEITKLEQEYTAKAA